MALDYISYLLQKRTVCLNISYSRPGSYIPGYQVEKFDFLGVLVSRDIGPQPSTSRPFLVYMFCLGICSLPPNDGVSPYETYIRCILHIPGYIDANFREYSLIRVDIMIQPSENGPNAVYFYVPETRSQNVGWFLHKFICLPTNVFIWIPCPYARATPHKTHKSYVVLARVIGGEVGWR